MPDASELNLDSILSREKQTKLSQLDPDFFETVLRQIGELESEKSGAEPDSKKDEDITEQLEVVIGQVRDIMHVRMYKIIRIASSQSVKRDKSDPPAMTHVEVKFYNALLSLMTAWRQDRLEQVLGKRQNKKVTGIATPRKEPEKPEDPKENKKDVSKDFIVLRLLRNVPTFVGMDERNYTLAKEDVVMVPSVNAKALIMRKAAVQIVMKKY